ncbi:MAG: hypothetical protein ACTHY4_04410 [Flavobacteriaceae bacterium]
MVFKASINFSLKISTSCTGSLETEVFLDVEIKEVLNDGKETLEFRFQYTLKLDK